MEPHSGPNSAAFLALAALAQPRDDFYCMVTAQRELVLTAYTKGVRMDDLATRRGQTPMALYKLLHRIRQSLLDCVQRTLAQEETV